MHTSRKSPDDGRTRALPRRKARVCKAAGTLNKTVINNDGGGGVLRCCAACSAARVGAPARNRWPSRAKCAEATPAARGCKAAGMPNQIISTKNSKQHINTYL